MSVQDPQNIQVMPEENGVNPFYKKINRKFLFVALGLIIFTGVALVVKTILFSPQITESETFLTYWGFREDSADIAALILQYESENKDVKINYIKQSKEDYRERLVNSLAKGSGPDIFSFHNTWLPMLGAQMSALPQSLMDQKAYQDIFYPTAVRDLTRDGRIYGIPLSVDGLGLYVNEEIFNSEGKNFPSTWDELRRVAFELTQKDESKRLVRSGVALGRTDNVDHWEDILSLMLLQNRANLTDFTTSAASEPIAFFVVFSTQDGIWDGSLPSSVQAFASGKVAMVFAPSWQAQTVKKLNPSLRFRVIPVPQLPKNTPTDSDISWASYWAEGVWSKSKNSDKAWKFVKFLAEKESLTKLYQSSVAQTGFGFPFSRLDMETAVQDDIFVGSYVKQARWAKSWYLASNTYDGQTGINSKLAQVFKSALDSVVEDRRQLEDLLPTITQGVNQVLLEYGLGK